MSRLKQLSATGNISGAADTIRLHSVVLTAGADAASLVVKRDGTSGTAVLTLKAAIATTVIWNASDSDGVEINVAHATFTGTSPVGDFEFR